MRRDSRSQLHDHPSRRRRQCRRALEAVATESLRPILRPVNTKVKGDTVSIPRAKSPMLPDTKPGRNPRLRSTGSRANRHREDRPCPKEECPCPRLSAGARPHPPLWRGCKEASSVPSVPKRKNPCPRDVADGANPSPRCDRVPARRANPLPCLGPSDGAASTWVGRRASSRQLTERPLLVCWPFRRRWPKAPKQIHRAGIAFVHRSR
jgi:hypothetical protein